MISVEEAWSNLLKHEGEDFYKVRGTAFTYKVSSNQKGFVVNCASFFLTKENFVKAFNLLPVDSPSQLNNKGVMGSSYLFGIITDKRIIGNTDAVKSTKVNLEKKDESKKEKSLSVKTYTTGTKVSNMKRQSIKVSGYEFSFLQIIEPLRDEAGRVLEYAPQSLYDNRTNITLHSYGDGKFCKFKVDAEEVAGVYLWIVENEIIYIGETANLRSRFNTGYGNISARNCFVGGQSTNCKMNKVVLELSKQNKKVYLYFYRTDDYKKVELELLQKITTKYNVKDNL